MNLHSLPALLLGSLLLAAAPAALADRGGRHGHDHGHGHDRHERYDDRRDHHDDGDHRGDVSIGIYFGDSHRHLVSDYYGPRFSAGHCPPGLARKGNGCMPPGQAKRWRMGAPLPRDVARYRLPHDLLVRLPAPPRGHEYVRVAGDILMIAVGSAMVVDAIQDITR